ncbi:DegT/DnrJ/EryC1/StrS family aminotransferase [Candidatus Pacearchaeota archaeon]|nr:DegT/DnrJ/EryC1/StrS family aminotransferase [Candidatus Pacearchaeota archaeon]
MAEKRRIFIGDFKIGEEEKAAVNAVLDSGRISEGKRVREFEQEWARYIGTNYAVAVSSGTAALIVGLEALKNHTRQLRPGDKIITSPVTYIATSNAIVNTGFEPIYADIDPRTFSLKPEGIEEILENDKNGEIRAILPVHLMGYPNDMDKINGLAKKYNLVVFEDSAQAHGSNYKGKKCGSLGDLADFSFYIAHNIQAGELGAITTSDYEIVRLAKKIKANGRMCDCPTCTRNTPKGCPKINNYEGDDDFDPRFTHDMTGYNFKTMDIQAALALTQIQRAEDIKKKRLENVKFLNEALKELQDKIHLPLYSDEVSYLGYPIIMKNAKARKEIRRYLETEGIETRPLFGCIPTQQSAYSHLAKRYEGKLPNAEHVGSSGFYIGCHQYLEKQDLEYIAAKFKEGIK